MKLRAGDFIIVFLTLFLAVWIWIYPHMKDDGKLCKISVDGKIFGELSLSEDGELSLPGCILKVRDGKAFVENSDCPDKVCEKTGKISKNGETIVCIPNRISIDISGESENDIIAG